MRPHVQGVVDEFGAMLRSQLDFRAEAEHNRRFARNFARLPGVRVPRLQVRRYAFLNRALCVSECGAGMCF